MNDGESSYRRFLAGDDSGMVEIIRDYKDGLILYVNSFVGNIHTAEEIMEDTFTRLVIKKPKFREKSSFKTWLYAIGRNTALDYLRRHSRQKELSLVELENLLHDEETLENSYIRLENKIALHRAVKRLNPDYRQVLYLVYFEDFSNTQVAAVMRKNTRQIENLIYRAKASLKKELLKEGFIYEEL